MSTFDAEIRKMSGVVIILKGPEIRIPGPYSLFFHLTTRTDFPQAVKIAVGVDSSRFLAHADAYLGRMSFLEVDALAAMFCFDIDEADMMRLGHRMRLLSDLNLQLLVITLCDNRQMVLGLAFCGVRLEFFHHVSTTLRHRASIDHLDDDVSAMFALIESRFHKHSFV